MMVGLASNDGKGTIELLYKEQPYHLMGECHLRKRNLLLCGFVDAIREAVRPTDEQHKALGDILQLLLHPLAEFPTGHLSSTFIEQNKYIAWLKTLQHLVGLAFLLLFLAQGLGILQVGNLLDLRRYIVRQALHVFIDERRINRSRCPTCEDDLEFQIINY